MSAVNLNLTLPSAAIIHQDGKQQTKSALIAYSVVAAPAPKWLQPLEASHFLKPELQTSECEGNHIFPHVEQVQLFFEAACIFKQSILRVQ